VPATGVFKAHSANLSIGLVGSETDELRDAQRGAIWSLAAHWTASTEPAQVVLPTGVGKTLVLSAAPFVYKAKRVLVVAPSRVVREQLEEAFRTLSHLKRTSALSHDVPDPEVQVVRGKATAGTWIKALEADVVVANVHGVSPTFAKVVPPDASLFDLVLVDEGHHVPAEAWRSLLEACNARMVFVTATPFRRDRRPIPGEIIYSYPLERAIANHVYTPVRFRPVTVGQDGDKDAALANAAKDRLRGQEHVDAGSRLLVRAGRVSHAEKLVEVYREIGVKLALVIAKTSWRGLQQMFASVRNGDLDGIVCVGSLTEGFDMPQLRIAAYHEPHKTLAPTLQFIGRLSRPGLAVTPELLAVPEDVGPETEILYREDRSWQDLLPDLVDGLVDEERQVRRFLNRGTWEPASLRIPPLAIRPARSARIFHVGGGQVNLDVSPMRLGGADVVWRFYSPESGLLAMVTQHAQRPRWLEDEMLDAWNFELHLACLVAERNILFLTSDVTPCLRDLQDAIGATFAAPVDGEELRRLAWQIAPDAWFSIGMRPTRMTGAAYEQSAGPRVENALGEDRLRGHSLGHGMAGGGGRGTFGFSVQKAKLWEPEATGNLLEFRRWCEERATDLATAARDTRGLPGLPTMTVATQFDAFPQTAVIAALMEHTLIRAQAPLVRGTERFFLHELELWAEVQSETEMRLELRREDELLWSALQHPSGRLNEASGGIDVPEPGTGELRPLDEILTEYPPIAHFADGSSVQGRHLERPHNPHRPVGDGLVEAWNWEGADVCREIGTPRAGLITVQAHVANVLAERCEVVLTDHGTGELCDLIGLTRLERGMAISLVHCKAAASDTPRRQLADIGEVLTQAARSARWADPAAGLWRELEGRRISRPTYFRVLHDPQELTPELFTQLRDSPPVTKTTIFAVQPGLATNQIVGWTEGESLINVAADWCRFGGTEFRLVGS
jgi:superfamily II DNA or RNA helicase